MVNGLSEKRIKEEMKRIKHTYNLMSIEDECRLNGQKVIAITQEDYDVYLLIEAGFNHPSTYRAHKHLRPFFKITNDVPGMYTRFFGQ